MNREAKSFFRVHRFLGTPNAQENHSEALAKVLQWRQLNGKQNGQVNTTVQGYSKIWGLEMWSQTGNYRAYKTFLKTKVEAILNTILWIFLLRKDFFGL